MYMDAIWEPDGHAIKVGDRVRIRLGGECPHTGSGDWPHRDVVSGECGEFFYFDLDDGVTQAEATHPYCVDFGIESERTTANGTIGMRGHRTARFARIELERLP